MCEDCTKIAFLKYCKDWRKVCTNCYKEYEEEKNGLSSKCLEWK